MAYPSTFSSVAGTTLVADADHASMHNAVETTVGTTAGTNVLKNFAAGDFPARINASNVLQQRVSGTVDTAVLGTPSISSGTITSGTINTSTLGTPTVTGGTFTSATINASVLGSPSITNGTINNATLGTPIITKISTGTVTQSILSGRALAPTVGTLTDAAGGTLTPNAAFGQVFELTLGTAAGNRTIASPPNATDGQSLVFRIKQNADVTGTIIWNSSFRWSGGTAGTAVLGTTASSWNYFGFRYNQTDTKWDDTGASKNIV